MLMLKPICACACAGTKAVALTAIAAMANKGSFMRNPVKVALKQALCRSASMSAGFITDSDNLLACVCGHTQHSNLGCRIKIKPIVSILKKTVDKLRQNVVLVANSTVCASAKAALRMRRIFT